MAATAQRSESVLLSEHGLQPRGRVYRNPTTAMLYTHALARSEGVLAEGGPLVVDTGVHTGRSPKDKFIVRDALTAPHVWWENTAAMDREAFDRLLADMLDYARDRDLYHEALGAGATTSSSDDSGKGSHSASTPCGVSVRARRATSPLARATTATPRAAASFSTSPKVPRPRNELSTKTVRT